MDLVIRSFAAALLSLAFPFASAQSLSLTIGNTVAGQNYAMKMAQFVFRVNGCADVSKVQMTATAEGIVGNARRSVTLRPAPAQAQSGVYAIGDQWGKDGTWVVAITASCLGATAGAIVPVNATSFVRDGTRLLSHAPSSADIETALMAYASPVSRPQ